MDKIKSMRIVAYNMDRYPTNCAECPAFKETVEGCHNQSWTGYHCELEFFNDCNGTSKVDFKRECHPDCKIRNCANVTVPLKIKKGE